MRTLDFLIVGAPKCGTSALHAFLGRHPQIFLPTHKEPHYFGSDLDFRDQARPDRDEYEALFAHAGADQRIGEASVFYLSSRLAAQEIRDHSPDCRIVIALRNPVDTMYSFHSQRLYNGTEDLKDFERALALEDERKMGRQLPKQVGLRQGLFYRDLVDFPTQVERYLDLFGRDQVAIFLHDDLVADPGAVYRNLCRFIGVGPSFETTFEVVNANKRVRYGWIRDQLWKPSPWARRLARTFIPEVGKRQALGRWLKSLNSARETRTPMNPVLRARLREEFGPATKRLEKLIDGDLSHWLER